MEVEEEDVFLLARNMQMAAVQKPMNIQEQFILMRGMKDHLGEIKIDHIGELHTVIFKESRAAGASSFPQNPQFCDKDSSN